MPTIDTMRSHIKMQALRVETAIVALRLAAKAHGYYVKEASARLVHICYSTGNPFYTVRIASRKRNGTTMLYYDIGECYILDAEKAIIKILQRTPK